MVDYEVIEQDLAAAEKTDNLWDAREEGNMLAGEVTEIRHIEGKYGKQVAAFALKPERLRLFFFLIVGVKALGKPEGKKYFDFVLKVYERSAKAEEPNEEEIPY